MCTATTLVPQYQVESVQTVIMDVEIVKPVDEAKRLVLTAWFLDRDVMPPKGETRDNYIKDSLLISHQAHDGGGNNNCHGHSDIHINSINLRIFCATLRQLPPPQRAVLFPCQYASMHTHTLRQT